jgi:adhesin/invasin
VNGRPAPLSYVSPSQVNLQIPFATSESFATFRVTTDGKLSNEVTLRANLTAPGVFTLTNDDGKFPPAIGPAAALHADYSLVTADHPAKAGETLQLYVTGLGAVTPSVADGAAAPSNPPSQVNDFVSVDILDQNQVDSEANVTFAGLAPGFAGLYQINFVVPSGVASGLAHLNVGTFEAYTTEAKLYMQ